MPRTRNSKRPRQKYLVAFPFLLVAGAYIHHSSGGKVTWMGIFSQMSTMPVAFHLVRRDASTVTTCALGAITNTSVADMSSSSVRENQSCDFCTNSGNKSCAKIIVHYHKTGTVLSGGLFKNIRKFAKDTTIKREGSFQTGRRIHDETTKCPLFAVKNDFFFKQDAPDLFCNLDKIFPPCTKVVHMIRNPFDWVLSNYLYHSQDPTPEAWVNELVTDPCVHSEESLDIISNITQLDRHLLDGIIRRCKHLYSKGNGTSYYDSLSNLDSYDGLQLATAHFLISNHWASGGDPVRMAANAVMLHASSGTEILTVDMADWLHDMKSTSKAVLDFLFSEDAMAEDVKLNISSAMEEQQEAAAGGSHVTSGKYEDKKEILRSWLTKEEQILSPSLRHVEMILNACTRRRPENMANA